MERTVGKVTTDKLGRSYVQPEVNDVDLQTLSGGSGDDTTDLRIQDVD